MAEVARLIAKLEADVRDFDRDMKKATKRLDAFEKETKQADRAMKKTGDATDGLGSKMKTLGKAVAAAYATKVIFDFAKASVGAAVDLNESINAVNVVFGESADGVKALGEQAADSLGLANAEFNSLSVQFSAFVEKIAGSSGRQVVDVLEELTGRAADFASVMNIDVAQAAQLFQSGLAGETEPLRKFGLDLSAAAVNAKALELGLAGTTSEITEQDKILARYNLLMEQTEKTAGDFANTSDELANATRRLSAKFTDAKAEIGSALIPVLEDLIPVGEKVVDFLVNAAIGFGQLTGAVTDVAAATRKAKLGLDADASSIEHMFAASKELLFILTGIDPDSGFTQLLNELTGQEMGVGLLADDVEELAERFGNLAEQFDITADEITQLREGGFDELAKDMGISTEALQVFLALLERDIKIKAFQDILDKTQETRDAVLDNVLAVLGLEPPDPDVADGFEEIRTEAEKAAAKIKLVHDRIRSLISPSFAAVNAAKQWATAQAELDELIESGVASQEELLAGAQAVLDPYLDLLAAADELDQVGLENAINAIRAFGLEAGIDLDVLNLMIEAMREAAGFKVEGSVIINGIDEALAQLERIRELNMGLGAPVGDPRPVFPASRGQGEDFALAGGGPAVAGRPYVVGEQGPELFVPRQSGTVVPNGGFGGATMNNTWNIGEVTDDALEEIQQELLLATLGQWSEVN